MIEQWEKRKEEEDGEEGAREGKLRRPNTRTSLMMRWRPTPKAMEAPMASRIKRMRAGRSSDGLRRFLEGEVVSPEAIKNDLFGFEVIWSAFILLGGCQKRTILVQAAFGQLA